MKATVLSVLFSLGVLLNQSVVALAADAKIAPAARIFPPGVGIEYTLLLNEFDVDSMARTSPTERFAWATTVFSFTGPYAPLIGAGVAAGSEQCIRIHNEHKNGCKIVYTNIPPLYFNVEVKKR